jgi:hypothetical protein
MSHEEKYMANTTFIRWYSGDSLVYLQNHWIETSLDRDSIESWGKSLVFKLIW